jgi:molybdate transport system substrate-binding protein
MMRRRTMNAGGAFLFGALILAATPACAAERDILVSKAVSEPFRQVVADFSKATQIQVRETDGTSGDLQQKLRDGVAADLVVISTAGLDATDKEKLTTPARVTIATAMIGVAVKAGAARPDISSVAAFKQALLAARNVTFVDPAAGGVAGNFIIGMLRKIGVAEAVAAKTVYQKQGLDVGTAVARGEAEIGITFTSEMQLTPGVQIAGLLPAEIQLPTVYQVAFTAKAVHRAEADALLRALVAAPAQKIFAHAGLLPVSPAP